MDESTNVENVAAGGDAGQPASTPSPTPTTPPSAVDVEALKKALRPVIAEEVAKSDQSIKDKRIAKLQGSVDEFQSQLAKLKELMGDGLSERQALREMKLDEALARLGVTETSAPAPSVSGNTAQPAVEETVLDFLREVKLDPNSPEITAELRKGGTPVEQIKRLAKVAINLGTARQPEPNPAAVMSTGGGQAVSPEDDLESIDRELERLKSKPKYQIDSKEYNRLYEKRQKLFQTK